MKEFFAGPKCAHNLIQFVDVFKMTQQLVTLHPVEALYLTFDGVHWGIEVNLIKTQILLQQISIELSQTAAIAAMGLECCTTRQFNL